MCVERVGEFGQVYLALSLWRRLGLHTLLKEIIKAGHEEVPWELTACVLRVGRFCGQRSELEPAQISRFHVLLDEHHYLGSIKPFGERLYYLVTEAHGEWVALLLLSAASKHLKLREHWIGWSSGQARRLRLLANNSCFLVLPDRAVPNLASKALRLVLGRLGADWQARYGHPVLVIETFVDPDQFCRMVWRLKRWEELAQTDGWGTPPARLLPQTRQAQTAFRPGTLSQRSPQSPGRPSQTSPGHCGGQGARPVHPPGQRDSRHGPRIQGTDRIPGAH